MRGWGVGGEVSGGVGCRRSVWMERVGEYCRGREGVVKCAEYGRVEGRR